VTLFHRYLIGQYNGQQNDGDEHYAGRDDRRGRGHDRYQNVAALVVLRLVGSFM
jgi:hypothetical protein